VVVVDDDPDLRLARIVESWGVTHVHRSAHRGDGLTEAGLDRASAVICAETNELATLEIALRVREPDPTSAWWCKWPTPRSVGPSNG
jgi:Trk K+ transport system NAD-binding subunit